MTERKVRLSGYLPAAEMDGLQPLLEALVRDPKDRRVVVGVMDVQTRRDHGDGDFEPTMRLLQVEVPQGELADAARVILSAAYSARTGAMQIFTDDWAGGVGGPEAEPVDLGPLAVTAGGGYRFAVSDEAPGRFRFELRSQADTRLLGRGGLVRAADNEWVVPGVYQLHELPDGLQMFADHLVREWETNAGTAAVSEPGGNVDGDEAATAAEEETQDA